MSPSVDFFGEPIRLVDEPSEWAMLEFAEAAGEVDTNELAGLAAIMRLLQSAVLPDDWQRFRALARKNNAKIDRDLMPIVVGLFSGATDRPTQRPSDLGWASVNAAEFNGRLILAGFAPTRPAGSDGHRRGRAGRTSDRLSLADRCDLAETLLLEGRDAKGRAAFYESLNAPWAASDADAGLRRMLGV